MTKLTLFLVGAGVASGLILWYLERKQNADQMSDRWRDEQFRRGLYTPFEGVTITFPIDKLKNEAAWWNTRQLKKRA